MTATLSKTTYCLGLQCAKLLWVHENDPGRIPAPGSDEELRLRQGRAVGELAKRMFPKGVEVPAGSGDRQRMAAETARILPQRKALFEAAFLGSGTYAQTDILQPVEYDEWDEPELVPADAWNIIEVKSSTKTKWIHEEDVTFQKACCEAAGLPVNHCILMHVNSNYVRDGEINPSHFFVLEDITESVRNREESVRENAERMLAVLNQPKCPEVEIGPHCSDPYDCPLKDQCWAFLPKHSVTTLYRLNIKKTLPLIRRGTRGIHDLPDTFRLSRRAAIQKRAVITKQPHVDASAIRSFLDGLRFPQYHLDFETFQLALPPYNGVHPYQQIPFQFSLHIWDSFDSEPRHVEFLADGDADPRPDLLAALKKHIGPEGDVVVYNRGFEESRLKEAAVTCPEYADFVSNLLRRIVDLLKPFRDFHYYHPDQQGSASIKKVLPVLAPNLSYNDLDIGDGGTASSEYVRITFGNVSDEERQKVRSALLKYCHLDTLAMIRIVQALRKIVQRLQ